jgi:hypothetical protein
MQLHPVSGGDLDMKKRATKALQDERLAKIQGGQTIGIDQVPDARTVKISLLIEPNGETAPPPDTGAVKISLLIEPGG